MFGHGCTLLFMRQDTYQPCERVQRRWSRPQINSVDGSAACCLKYFWSSVSVTLQNPWKKAHMYVLSVFKPACMPYYFHPVSAWWSNGRQRRGGEYVLDNCKENDKRETKLPPLVLKSCASVTRRDNVSDYPGCSHLSPLEHDRADANCCSARHTYACPMW